MVFQPAAESELLLKRLQHENRWFLTDEHNCCSCAFRHVGVYYEDGSSFEPEFSEPEDWRQEDPESIEGTSQLFDVIHDLSTRGFKVDLIDAWNGEELEQFVMDVELSSVKRETFRMFEDYLMRFPISAA